MSRHNRERRRKNREAKRPDGPVLYAGRPSGYSDAVAAATQAAQARGELLPGRVYEIPVRHDDGCALLAGRGPCDCVPEVGRPELVPAPEDN